MCKLGHSFILSLQVEFHSASSPSRPSDPWIRSCQRWCYAGGLPHLWGEQVRLWAATEGDGRAAPPFVGSAVAEVGRPGVDFYKVSKESRASALAHSVLAARAAVLRCSSGKRPSRGGGTRTREKPRGSCALGCARDMRNFAQFRPWVDSAGVAIMYVPADMEGCSRPRRAASN